MATITAGSGIRGVIRMRGAKELGEALKAFGPAMEKKVLRKAMRDSAKPILADAKARAPVSSYDGPMGKKGEKADIRRMKKAGVHYPGMLRDSLKILSIKRNRAGRVGVVISTAKGFFKGETFYGAFIEFGTRNMAARPFIRPAFDSQRAQSIRVVEASVKQGIEDVAKGLRRLTKLDKELLTPGSDASNFDG